MISKPVVTRSYILHVFPCHHLPRPTHRPVQKNLLVCTQYTCVCVRIHILHSNDNNTWSEIDKMAKQLMIYSSMLDGHVLYRCIVHLGFCDTFWLHVS